MARSFLILIILGFSTPLAKAGGAFTQADKAAMNAAQEKVLGDEELNDGYEVGFKGDRNSGYFKLVDQGHQLNREDLHCRKILSVTGGDSVTKIFCFKNREREWVVIDPKNYVADPVVSAHHQDAAEEVGIQR